MHRFFAKYRTGRHVGDVTIESETDSKELKVGDSFSGKVVRVTDNVRGIKGQEREFRVEIAAGEVSNGYLYVA